MKKLPFLSQLVALALTCSASLAQAPLPMPRNLRATYDKGTRTATGRPGPRYWQNTADYTIAVDFNPASRKIQGEV
ncbi:MAG: peptidase, partial [Cytophagaceae bacterium]